MEVKTKKSDTVTWGKGVTERGGGELREEEEEEGEQRKVVGEHGGMGRDERIFQE